MPGASTSPTSPGEILPPIGYSPAWLLLGLAVIAAVACYFVLVVLSTRRRTPAAVAQPAPTVDLGRSRDRAITAITSFEQQAAAGQLAPRLAYERISAAMREYVATATGVPADHMTLTDLAHSELQGTAQTVAQLYPGIFAPDAQRNVPAVAAQARAVVSQWS